MKRFLNFIGNLPSLTVSAWYIISLFIITVWWLLFSINSEKHIQFFFVGIFLLSLLFFILWLEDLLFFVLDLRKKKKGK